MVINTTEELLQFVDEQRNKQKEQQVSLMRSPPGTPRTRGSAELFTDGIPSSLPCTPRKAQKEDPFEPPPPPDWRASADDLFGPRRQRAQLLDPLARFAGFAAIQPGDNVWGEQTFEEWRFQ